MRCDSGLEFCTDGKWDEDESRGSLHVTYRVREELLADQVCYPKGGISGKAQIRKLFPHAGAFAAVVSQML